MNYKLRVTSWGFPHFASGVLVLFFLVPFSLNAQEITASIDSTSIKIGEQIHYRISIETDTADLVVFPEGQTFLPMEMVEASPVDTSDNASLQRLFREYSLTKFDSGTYVIPSQKIIINGRTVATDSFLVKVNPVLVDTTKQKMYPIKPVLDVPGRYEFPTWIWWVLGGLVFLLVLGWFLFRRKKKKEEAKRNIPPFEKAMLTLKELDEGKLLEEREIKAYYSVLTDAARRYLDEQVDERAMESTTDELIARLQMQKDAGKLTIEQQIIDDFQHILQRADLAKFARSKPDVFTAKEDRSNIEKIIKDTKQGIPEPTEEELQKDEAYRKKMAEKKRRKQRLVWIISGIGTVLLALVILISVRGPSSVIDPIFGNSTKELLRGEWIGSEYGNPPVWINTPEVLVRKETEIPEEMGSKITAMERFSSGSLSEEFYVVLNTIHFKQQENFDPEKASENVYADLEAQGAKNIVTKKEEFTTATGIEGQKISGSFSIKEQGSEKLLSKEYVLLNFNEGGALQQILLVAKKGDEYADQIMSRVEYSVEFNKPGN